MRNEKHDLGSEKRVRTVKLCTRCMAVVSAAVLARVVQRVRRNRQEKQQQVHHHHRRFPLVGH